MGKQLIIGNTIDTFITLDIARYCSECNKPLLDSAYFTVKEKIPNNIHAREYNFCSLVCVEKWVSAWISAGF